jgi:UDP-glucose:glycoprotein glucosyltransferase
MKDEDPLEALIHISQDFPKLVTGLARKVGINESLQRDIVINQQSMRMGNMVWINGRFIGPLEANAISFLDVIREERHRALSLCALGLTPQQAFEILSDDSIGEALSSVDPLQSLVDSSDKPEGGNVIQWWNNIEKDSRYASWPEAISVLLTPQRPGGFQPVRKNLWNVVLVLDLSTRTGLHTVSQTVSNFIRRGIPFRFGVVPWVKSDPSSPSAVMARVVQHLIKHAGRGQTADFIASLLHASNQPTINLRQVETLFDSAFASDGASGKRFKDIINDTEGTEYLRKVQGWLARLGVAEESPAGHVFFNGQHHQISDVWLQQVMQDHTSQLAYLQNNAKIVRKAKNIGRFFYDLPTTSRRRNVHIIPGSAQNKLRVFDNRDIFPDGSPLLKHFIYPANSHETPSLLSAYVIADLDSAEGWRSARDILRYLQQQPNSELRLGFHHVPSYKSGRHLPFRMSTLLYRLYSTGELSLLSPEELLLLSDILDDKAEQEDLTARVASAIEQLPGDSVIREWLSAEEDPLTVAASRQFWAILTDSRQSMGIQAGLVYLQVNGRLIGPLEENAFSAEDYASLERYELHTRARPIFSGVQAFYQDFENLDR